MPSCGLPEWCTARPRRSRRRRILARHPAKSTFAEAGVPRILQTQSTDPLQSFLQPLPRLAVDLTTQKQSLGSDRVESRPGPLRCPHRPRIHRGQSETYRSDVHRTRRFAHDPARLWFAAACRLLEATVEWPQDAERMHGLDGLFPAPPDTRNRA